MVKSLIIHCGFHKTASSSIQHTLAKNREKLEELGFHYPALEIDGNNFYNCSIPLYGFFTEQPNKFRHYTYFNNYDVVSVNKKIESLIFNDIAQKNNVIFSDEYLSRLSVSALRKMKNVFEELGFAIQVIAYVRNPYELAITHIQQRIELNNTIQSLLNNFDRLPDNHTAIENLIEVFDKEVEFHCFEKACQKTDGPVGYFFNLLGIKKYNEFEFVRVNESLSMQSIRLVSYINEHWPQYVEDNNINQVRRVGDIYPLHSIKGNKFSLSEIEFKQIETIIKRDELKSLALLNKDFFLPARLSLTDKFYWNLKQVKQVYSAIPLLPSHIAVLTFKYFLEQYREDKLSLTSLSLITKRVIISHAEQKNIILNHISWIEKMKLCLNPIWHYVALREKAIE